VNVTTKELLNRSIFAEVISKTKVAHFMDHTYTLIHSSWLLTVSGSTNVCVRVLVIIGFKNYESGVTHICLWRASMHIIVELCYKKVKSVEL